MPNPQSLRHKCAGLGIDVLLPVIGKSFLNNPAHLRWLQHPDVLFGLRHGPDTILGHKAAFDVRFALTAMCRSLSTMLACHPNSY
jgi:hypothetical protein